MLGENSEIAEKQLFVFNKMNFKLLATTALLLTVGTASAFAADKEELAEFKSTGKCIDCNLSKMQEDEAGLKNIDVQGANISRSTFKNSDLRNANFTDTNAANVSFAGADLRNADFRYANVSGANFCDADLRGVNWKEVTYSNSTRCLPDEALASVSESGSNRRSISENVDSVKKNAASVKRTSESVKETTQTVKDIFNMF